MQSVMSVPVSAWRTARHQSSTAGMTLGERLVRAPLINAALGKLRFAGWWLVYHRGPARVWRWMAARMHIPAFGRGGVPEVCAYARTRTRA